MRWLVLISLPVLNGCVGNGLGEVRATAPVKTRTFPALYDQLAACAKHHIETNSWLMGQPMVHSAQDRHTPLVSVYANLAGSTLFEVTFQPAASAMTLVKYRRGYDGYDSQEKTWAIIERCVEVDTAPDTPDANIPAESSSPTIPSPPSP